MYTKPQRLRSKQDYETEYEFINTHTRGHAEIMFDAETGRVSHAIYRCPINGFYKERPDSDIAWSDVTGKIDKVISDGPNHPDASENISKIMDGTI